jgi:imidazole glycerol-phosphate synthase subunit HisH
MTTIGLIDYGAGNFTSVMNAFERLDIDTIRISAPDQLDEVDRLVLPGVGAFKIAMDHLESRGLIEALHTQVLDLGKPFLGICVGMQILADVGLEFEISPGLGFVSGVCEIIPAAGGELRVPHMGWNEVSFPRQSPLFDGIEDHETFYFVHSYHLNPANNVDILATSEYGGNVVAAVGKDNIFGVQFHPEKSQNSGLKVLKNFTSMSLEG